MRAVLFIVCISVALAGPAAGQESPYFVTYDHHLEEPGNLEIEASTTIGVPRAGNPGYFAPYSELEYGVTGWWTSELYLEGLSRRHDSTIFTGWRLENRFRPLAREHRINPILYIEYEDLNEASRIQKEIVGHAEPLDEPNSLLRRNHARELEGKLILSSQARDWNISENLIAEKNLSANEGFEFGYAFGVARPLSTIASAKECTFCRENFRAGVEAYGGLGSSVKFGLQDTAHYVAPVISWRVSPNASLRFSAGFGLTGNSQPVLVRASYSYEIRGFGSAITNLFKNKD